MPVILMTAQATLQSAMQAVNEGAFYYIQKPFRNDELMAILRRAAEHRKLRVENKSLKQEIRRAERHGDRASRREEQAVARRAAPRRDRRADRFDGAHPGRVGNRQGSHRALHPRALDAHRGAVPVDQLRRAPREPARERIVRSREGIVHRRDEGQDRPLRRGDEGHVLPRRNRRDDAGDAGQAPARAAASRSDSRRRDGSRSRSTRASSPRPIATSTRRSARQLPQRPLLPAERHRAAPAAAAPARATTSRCSSSTSSSASPRRATSRAEAPDATRRSTR